MQQSTDLVVIGSGFGGLTAAALAAAAGARVELIEQHTRPGGCAGDFALGGFWFPAGATVVTGLEPGGILRQVFDTLEVQVDSRPLDPSIVFHAGGTQLQYSMSTESWKESLRKVFPATARAYERFWDWTHTAGGQVYAIGAHLPSLPLRSFSDVRRTAPALSPGLISLLPVLPRTIRGQMRRLGAGGEPVIDGIIDALLMDATGAAAGECSAVQGAIALDLYRRGCQWVEGGTGRLAMELVRAIRRAGSTVSFATAVARLRRIGRDWFVSLSDGRELTARAVIANVPPAGLDRLLGHRPRLPEPGTAWGAFVLHLGIDATGLVNPYPYHQVLHPEDAHGNSFISIFPSAKRDSIRWSLSVSRHVDPRTWLRFPAELARARNDLEQSMLDDVARVVPDVRKRALLVRSATPATFERFTARPGGYVGGLVQRPNVVALRAPGHRPAEGLFMAGDHVFPGQGTVGTALSGINAYRDALEYLGRKPAL